MKRLNHCFLFILFLLACFWYTGILKAQEQGGQITDTCGKAGDLIDRLLARHDKPGVPGVAITVLKGGRMVFQKGYGLANLEYEVPVTPGTQFHVASVSKQFTVFSVLLLAESGQLSLDDDIRDYVREVPDFGHTITLRQLIHHTSGLRDQWDLLIMAGWRLGDVITQEQILRMISWQKELNFPPGEQYMYCNTGYTLLAEVVEKVSGQSFPEFTRDNIFYPLGMKHTFFCDDHEKIIRNRAYSYHLDNEGYKKSTLNYASTGATGLYTTVEDLIKWVRNFKDPLVGNDSIFEKMRQRGTLNDGDTIDYAMGQMIGTYQNLQMISHAGSDAGYKAFLGRIPEKDFALIMLSNDASFPETLLANKIIDIYLNPPGGGAQGGDASTHRTVPATTNQPASELEKYCGTYWNDKELYMVHVRLRDDTLRFIWPGGVVHPLIPSGKATFKMSDVLTDIRVVFDHQRHPGKTLNVQLKGFDSIVFTSYLQIEYTAASLDKYTGTYFSQELATWYRFEISGGSLVATHRRHGDIRLEPFGLDLFQGNGLAFGKIKFIHNMNGYIRGCNISSARARDIWFVKVAR